MNRTARSLGGERLIDHLPAGCFQLLANVSARLLARLRFRRTWPQINQSLDVGERLFTGKFLPRLAVTRSGVTKKKREANDQKKDQAKERVAAIPRPASGELGLPAGRSAGTRAVRPFLPIRHLVADRALSRRAPNRRCHNIQSRSGRAFRRDES